jgi:aspartate-semialdehyde dehydrogenase
MAANPRVGLIGWRGMVGSVLVERMRAEGDFALIDPTFYSTTQAGAAAPEVGRGDARVADANDLEALARADILVSCQGGDYTAAVHPKLRAAGWRGHWIDAASALRHEPGAVIILDPVNRDVIDAALAGGKVRDWIGGNCTVSLMLMAFGGLFRAGLVEWLTTMTYQAASGAGAREMRELLAQMGHLHRAAGALLDDPASAILEIDRRAQGAFADMPAARLGHPLAGSLLPWIDRDLGDGRSREEWKAGAEGNKILGRTASPVPIDGLCVRIGAMRCHSQAVTIRLKRPMPVAEVERAIAAAHAWIRLVPNEREATLARLTPAAVGGTLDIAVGRLRHLEMGEDYVTAFTVGDQLLWGAAEPLRRMLRLLAGR